MALHRSAAEARAEPCRYPPSETSSNEWCDTTGGSEGTGMIASLKGYGRIARTLLAALGALLALGIIGSLLMGVHARHSAQDQIVQQAQTITDSSLTLAFTPADLN